MKFLNPILPLVLSLLFSSLLPGQDQKKELEELILKKDALFWQDYNSCNTSRLDEFFTEDLEFYHDKSGVISGLNSFTEVIRNGLCKEGGSQLRREVVPGSMKVFLLNKDGRAYGAILSGDHLFYLKQSGRDERLDGRAKFTHLWLLNNNDWKMARVLSYDHGPATGSSKP